MVSLEQVRNLEGREGGTRRWKVANAGRSRWPMDDRKGSVQVERYIHA